MNSRTSSTRELDRRSSRNLFSRCFGVTVGIAGTVGAFGSSSVVRAHEGDYYPEETIPEVARTIIEESTTRAATPLIYVGITALVFAGATIFILNLLGARKSGPVEWGGHKENTSADPVATSDAD